MSRRIGIGIDTGGTYTDAVAYDFGTKTVLGTAKALTTRRDLALGILEALDNLPPDIVREAGTIALSTTLATNACVEDKGGRAKLLFLGGEEKVIREFGPRYGLPPPEEMYLQESYSHFSGEIDREPDWERFEKNIESQCAALDGAGILEIYAMRNGAVLEKKARDLFRKRFSVPVVCGHELEPGLNCLQRGAGVLLNARLFPVIEEFLQAIKRALAARDIHGRVVIVRSDGSLMSEDFAARRPVETLLCGPAASAAGGMALAGERDALIVDMGGTTTDMALVRDGRPVQVPEGVTVGRWKTFVKGLAIKTFGLGGDTAVHYREGRLVLENYRVTPLCVLAEAYPAVIGRLRRLVGDDTTHSFFLHEFFYLPGLPGETGETTGDDSLAARYTERENKFRAALRDGPLSLQEAAEAADTDVYNLDVTRLVREGVVLVAGLTPTDIMHIRGDFSRFSREAATMGAKYVARNLGLTVDALCARVYYEVKRRLYVNVVTFLLERLELERGEKGGGDPAAGAERERLIGLSYDLAAPREGRTGPGRKGSIQKLLDKRDGLAAAAGPEPAARALGLSFSTGCVLVGIGAPVGLFLPDVAALLGTRVVTPEHYEVANALGAVAGAITASVSVEVRPVYKPEGIAGYVAEGAFGRRSFKTREKAEAFAAERAAEEAREEARRRGAEGELTVTLDTRRNEGASREGTVDLGSVVTARAGEVSLAAG